jgi:putative drug exporter of the RND superfamily
MAVHRVARARGSRSGLTERLARGCAAHPRRVLVAWGVAIVVALALAVTSLHGLTSSTSVTGNPESARASAAIAAAFPPSAAEQRLHSSDVVVVVSKRYTAASPQFRSFVTRLVGNLRASGKVSNVVTPALVSRSGRAVLLPILIRSDAASKPVVAVVQTASRTPGFQVSVTGTHTAGNDFNVLSQSDLKHGELGFGLPAAFVILLLVFGAVVAGLIPVLMAMVAIMVGLGIVTLLSLEFNLSVFIVNMLSGMGLALGIDYSLFVISRYREERGAGAPEEAAIALAGATASRAVLFSGSTFVVALLGMLIVPTTIMRSLAAGAIVVGVVSVAAALTLLPALLSVLGDRVNALRVPVLGRSLGHGTAEGRFWGAIVRGVLRRPALSLVIAVGVMLAAAVPVFGLHIGASGVASLPDSTPSKQGYLAVQREFPTSSAYPVQIVVQGTTSAIHHDLVVLRRRLASTPPFGASQMQVSASHDVSVLTVQLRGNPVGGAAISAVRDLRSRVLPAALAGSGAKVLVGGVTEQNSEYFDAVTGPTPYVMAFVLGLSLILLMIAFRSLMVALVSILLNLLSVGAAYGLLTLVFLDGHGTSFFGFQRVHAIDAWVPLFLFSVLFGLSMDYQVFLMSRIKERYDRGVSTREAVETGVSSTARIITGAALIIVVVFTGFARGQLVQFQEMGFGVAVALLLDATVIRSVVLPSTLAILGSSSWYLPSWLSWLPQVEVEGHGLANEPTPEPAT